MLFRRGFVNREIQDTLQDDIRDILSYHLAFKRIVVKEHHGIKSDVKNVLDSTDIVNLGFPVGNEDSNVIKLQHHVWVLFKWFLSRFLIVFGNDTDDDATLLQLFNPHLKLRKGLADTKTMSQLYAF